MEWLFQDVYNTTKILGLTLTHERKKYVSHYLGINLIKSLKTVNKIHHSDLYSEQCKNIAIQANLSAKADHSYFCVHANIQKSMYT